MNKIFFTPIYDIEKNTFPQPAQKVLPEWYKKTTSFINSKKFIPQKEEGDHTGAQTIKKCMPVFDALTAGYIIKTHAEIYVSRTLEGDLEFYSPFEGIISFHPFEQAKNHPQGNKKDYPKFISPWSIKTKRGYSCLFLPPMHRENTISILPGIVDTDEYISPVNFPFMLSDNSFEGIIPAGTPIVQIIPFKRDSFTLKIKSDKEVIEKFSRTYLNRFVNNYKNKFWKKKFFK